MEQWKAWEKEVKTKESLLYATLKELDKNALVDLYMRCSEHFPAANTFALFQNANSPVIFTYANELIQGTIQNELHLVDHPTEAQVLLAVEGGEVVLERANSFLNQKDYLTAMQLYLLILSNYIPILHQCDQVSEPVGFLIDRCINLIQNTVLKIGKSSSILEKRVAFEKICEEASKPVYRDWFDWRFDLLQSCVCLCDDPVIREGLEQTVGDIISSMSGNANYRKYVGGQLHLILYSIVQSFDTPDKVHQFVQESVQYDTFRQMAIVDLLAEEDYEKVLELCNNSGWDAYAFEAYGGIGDVVTQISCGEALVLRGETEFYPKLKSLFSEEDWIEERDTLLDCMELQDLLPETYLTIAEGEQLSDRLFSYIEKNPHLLYEVDTLLIDSDSNRAKELFFQSLLLEANGTNFSLDEEADSLMEKIEHFFDLFGEQEKEDLFFHLRSSEAGGQAISYWKLWTSLHGGDFE